MADKPLEYQVFMHSYAGFNSTSTLFYGERDAVLIDATQLLSDGHRLAADLIEMGIDALNPVQVSAAGMDTAWLKREFGKDLTFWGAACDSQTVLPFGSPQEVADEVKRRIDDLAPGGGFVLAPIHNIQAGVPAENVVAMFEAARKHGGYA